MSGQIGLSPVNAKTADNLQHVHDKRMAQKAVTLSRRVGEYE